MSKTALVILAPGAEEMEFTIAVDVLRRAGIAVTVAGLCNAGPVRCSRDVKIIPDSALECVLCCEFDIIIIPGGFESAQALSLAPAVGELLKRQETDGKFIGAICAGPIVLDAHKVYMGKNITGYPTFREQLSDKYKYVDEKVVVDDKLITSKGPATAFDFSLKIVEILLNAEQSSNVAKMLLLTE